MAIVFALIFNIAESIIARHLAISCRLVTGNMNMQLKWIRVKDTSLVGPHNPGILGMGLLDRIFLPFLPGNMHPELGGALETSDCRVIFVKVKHII